MYTICVYKRQRERDGVAEREKIVGFNLTIWCPRACEVGNKNVFMQIVSICDFSILPPSAFPSLSF